MLKPDIRLELSVLPYNLGFNILPSKVVSDTPFLGYLWMDLAEILMEFWPGLGNGQKSTKFQTNQSTDSQDDATYEGNSSQPKLKGRSLVIKRREVVILRSWVFWTMSAAHLQNRFIPDLVSRPPLCWSAFLRIYLSTSLRVGTV